MGLAWYFLLPSSHSPGQGDNSVNSGWALVSRVTGGLVSWIIFLWAHTLWGEGKLVCLWSTLIIEDSCEGRHAGYLACLSCRKATLHQAMWAFPSHTHRQVLKYLPSTSINLWVLVFNNSEQLFMVISLLPHLFPMRRTRFTFWTNWGFTVISWSMAFSRSSSSIHFSICTRGIYNHG